MRDELFALCRRYADAHVDSSGVAVTPVPGITLVRALHPGDLQAAIARPLVAMLLQGRKSVTTGLASFDYGPGEAMVIAADVPTTSQITEASQRFPYYALVLELDLAILRELQEVGPSGADEAPRVGIEPMNADVTDAAYRLARLFDQPGALAVLGEGLRRELHYWLLQSVHGAAIRALGVADRMTMNKLIPLIVLSCLLPGVADSHSARIRRAVAVLRRDFMQPVSVDALADAAGMSVSVFHRHFRAMTTLSPLQFQKQLRLIHARRLMLAEGMSIAQAAGEVGYISVSQFTREYARLYGAPPGRDRRRERMSA
ncbi:AraC family transcriptional regulator [Klebsiella quasipneumoniae subsp. quasipneumoniae]|uniref:AraC family transcriptional regulator n=1 Tax=Klebsiella quasipneumoniae TaxID=1463165 RepID=UPI002F9696A7